MTYNEIIQKPGREIQPIVYYYDNENNLIEIDRDNFIRAKLSFNAPLIGTVMRSLEVELKKELPNVAIYLKNKVKYNNYTAERIYGPYFSKENPIYNADSRTYTHNLCDAFLNTMIDYKPLTISYPTTVLSFFQRLCLECGLTTNITSLPNGTKIIEKDIYNGINFTYRDVFTDIGQATATLFGVVDNEIIKYELGTSDITINDDILKNQNIEFGEHYGPINSIVLSRSADSDNIYKRDENLNNWNEFRISDNQLMNDNNRNDYLEDLYSSLYGIEYDIFDCELVGYGGFNELEKIRIETLDKDGKKKIYNSYIFNNEQIITKGFTESIYTEYPEESITNYKSSDTTDKRINQAFMIVDKQNQTIEALTSTTKVLDTTVNNNYQELTNKFDGYVPESDFVALESSVKQLQTDTYTKTEINTKLTDGSVTKVMTTSGTFDENGMHYEKTNAPTNSTINEKGVEVDSTTTGEELLFAGYDEEINQTIVRTENLTVRKYLVIGNNSRIEDYGNGGGIFIL